MTYTKSDIASCQIFRYLHARLEGELDNSQFDTKLARKRKNRRKKRGKKVEKSFTPKHFLCPDKKTLDNFFGDFLNFLYPKPYRVAVTYESIPSWLNFLESIELIDSEQHRQAIIDLHPLRKDLLKVLSAYNEDPFITKGIIQKWPEKLKD